MFEGKDNPGLVSTHLISRLVIVDIVETVFSVVLVVVDIDAFAVVAVGRESIGVGMEGAEVGGIAGDTALRRDVSVLATTIASTGLAKVVMGSIHP